MNHDECPRVADYAMLSDDFRREFFQLRTVGFRCADMIDFGSLVESIGSAVCSIDILIRHDEISRFDVEAETSDGTWAEQATHA